MTIQESLSILRIYQQWRMGADIPMLEPKEITEAINTVLEYTSQVVDKLGNEDVSKLGYVDKLAEEHITKHHLNHSYTTSKFSFKEGYKAKDTQIPNDEIFKAALDYDNMTSYNTPIGHFQMGAFWYREQLKQRQ